MNFTKQMKSTKRRVRLGILMLFLTITMFSPIHASASTFTSYTTSTFTSLMSTALDENPSPIEHTDGWYMPYHALHTDPMKILTTYRAKYTGSSSYANIQIDNIKFYAGHNPCALYIWATGMVLKIDITYYARIDNVLTEITENVIDRTQLIEFYKQSCSGNKVSKTDNWANYVNWQLTVEDDIGFETQYQAYRYNGFFLEVSYDSGNSIFLKDDAQVNPVHFTWLGEQTAESNPAHDYQQYTFRVGDMILPVDQVNFYLYKPYYDTWIDMGPRDYKHYIPPKPSGGSGGGGGGGGWI